MWMQITIERDYQASYHEDRSKALKYDHIHCDQKLFDI